MLEKELSFADLSISLSVRDSCDWNRIHISDGALSCFGTDQGPVWNRK